MKILIAILTSILLFIIVFCKSPDTDQGTPYELNTADTTAVATPGAINVTPALDSASAEKAWEAYMTPSAMHKIMAASEGRWTAEIVFWMSPGAEPTPPSKVTVINKMILGGRYLQSEYKGKMSGMDFDGKGIMGYDNASGKFVNSWIDNMGTGIMYVSGEYDEKSKSIVMSGSVNDPLSGRETPIRQVLTTIDDRNQVLQMYDTREGKQYKSMEIKLVRK
jgi:hypothetical protein